MKKIFLSLLLISTFSAQAVIIHDPIMYTCNDSEDDLVGFCFVISTTTSLPTLIVEGVEIDLNTPEAKERLEAELRGDIEPVLLNQLQLNQGK